MTYDRPIIISAGKSRKDINWQRQTLTVSELYDRLKTPARGVEALSEYTKMKKAQQDDLKDVGGFVAGALAGGRRKANAVTGRDVITLDFDNVPGWQTDAVLATLDGLKCNYCVYSTRKHAPNAPRLRVLIPTDRTMTPDEYEPCARRMADYIGISMADPTTFEVSRLMYWPSCCSDSEFVFRTADEPFASVDSLLASYKDWHDISEWPQVPGSFSYQKLAVKQGDPEAKPGIVGAFCRTYDIYRAIDELLPGIYEAVDNEKDRYTYLGGSTTGGAIVYDNGKFLFSHHATDPCSGRLVNSFDMVRLHRFGDADDVSDASTPANRLPSYKRMLEYANSLDDVAVLLMQERYDSAIADFEGVGADNADDPGNWMLKLQREPQTGRIKGSIDNVRIILENDPLLKGRFALNRFAGRGEVLEKLPWDVAKGEHRRRMWSDTDSNGLYWYMEKQYAITGRGNIDAALDIHAATHAFNEVQDYIEGLTWDGTPRLDTLFIDYLGAEDNSYTRAVTRKMLVAAVARCFRPGCKFDQICILSGKQGIGKSLLLSRLGRDWFNDSITSFDGKEARENLRGVWIVELGEMTAFSRSESEAAKQFLSQTEDRYRAAYGRRTVQYPRRCVFFGTSNSTDFLRDATGNRRYWPIDCSFERRTKLVHDDLTPAEVDQIWAEAVARYQQGEELILRDDLLAAAMAEQQAHMERDPWEGQIEDFLNRPVPADWMKRDIDQRICYWETSGQSAENTVQRTSVCVNEIWRECIDRTGRELDRQQSKRISAVLANIPGWVNLKNSRRCGPYGTQRVWVREEQ